MTGQGNMTLAELVRQALELGNGQEQRYTVTVKDGEVYGVRLFAGPGQAQASFRGGGSEADGVTSIDRSVGEESDGVTSIDRQGTGQEGDGVTSIDHRSLAARDGDGAGQPTKTFRLELTRRL